MKDTVKISDFQHRLNLGAFSNLVKAISAVDFKEKILKSGNYEVYSAEQVAEFAKAVKQEINKSVDVAELKSVHAQINSLREVNVEKGDNSGEILTFYIREKSAEEIEKSLHKETITDKNGHQKTVNKKDAEAPPSLHKKLHGWDEDMKHFVGEEAHKKIKAHIGEGKTYHNNSEGDESGKFDDNYDKLYDESEADGESFEGDEGSEFEGMNFHPMKHKTTGQKFIHMEGGGGAPNGVIYAHGKEKAAKPAPAAKKDGKEIEADQDKEDVKKHINTMADLSDAEEESGQNGKGLATHTKKLQEFIKKHTGKDADQYTGKNWKEDVHSDIKDYQDANDDLYTHIHVTHKTSAKKAKADLDAIKSKGGKVEKGVEDNLEKGAILDSFNSYGNNKLSFSKTGKEIKTQITSVVLPLLNAQKLKLSNDLVATATLIGEDCKPAQTVGDYYYRGFAKVLPAMMVYSYKQTEPAYNEISRNYDEATDEQKYCRQYNDIVYGLISTAADIEYCNTLVRNLSDTGKFELTPDQLLNLQF